MNIKPEQIPDEVVEAAIEAIRAEELRALGGYKTPDNGARRNAVRHALSAALPVLLVQVGFAAPESLNQSERRMSWFDVWRTQHPPFTIPLYALPTQDTPNEQ